MLCTSISSFAYIDHYPFLFSLIRGKNISLFQPFFLIFLILFFTLFSLYFYHVYDDQTEKSPPPPYFFVSDSRNPYPPLLAWYCKKSSLMIGVFVLFVPPDDLSLYDEVRFYSCCGFLGPRRERREERDRRREVKQVARMRMMDVDCRERERERIWRSVEVLEWSSVGRSSVLRNENANLLHFAC